MREIVWSDAAKENLADIDAYWWLNSPTRADEILDRIYEAGKFLTRVPGAGSMYTGFRKWRVQRTDYLLTYRVLSDQVEILRVRHARDDWKPGP